MEDFNLLQGSFMGFMVLEVLSLNPVIMRY